MCSAERTVMVDVEFRILGPLEVRLHDTPVRLSGPREHRLLAVLLLSANRLVPMSRLVDGVWDDEPPATAKRQVQNGLSALRNRLCPDGPGASPIVAVGGGYQVRVGEGELDAGRFQRLVEQAESLPADRVPERARLLREALALWRGPALADIGGRDIRAGAVRLDEQRLAAHEWCIDLELELGRHEALVGELTELVAAHPLRERPVGQLMRALYRSARKAEALQAFQALRERLADEVGLDPSAELQRLQLAILRGDLPTPLPAEERQRVGRQATRPVAEHQEPGGPDSGERSAAGGSSVLSSVLPRQLPNAAPGFVGRRAELAALDALAAPSRRDGTAGIVVITGTAGVGKTAVALSWAHRTAELFPDGQLYADLRGFARTAAPLHPGEALAGFLDAFGVPPGRMPSGLDARSALFRSLLSDRRVLVLLDNVRDLDQVRPLLPGAPACLVLLTSRDRLAGLVAVEGARPILVEPLAQGEARELLEQRIGRERTRAEPEAVERIIAHSARLPLALSVVAARAAARPAVPLAVQAEELAGAGLDALGGRDPAADVREAFSWSYQALGGQAARLFRSLGLHPGPVLTVAAAAGLTGTDPAHAQAAMVELCDTHLVAEHAPGRFGSHALLRAYAAELVRNDPEEEREQAVRGLLDHYLHSAFAADRLLCPSRDPIEVVPPARAPVPGVPADLRNAEAWFAAEHPLFPALVELAAAWRLDVHAWQLAWSVTTYLDRRGHWRELAEVHRHALEATRRLAGRHEEARAHRLLAGALIRLRRLQEAEDHLAHALRLCRELRDRVGEAETLRHLGLLSGRVGRHEEALAHARAALDLHRAAGHRPGEADALDTVGRCLAMLGEYQEALAFCQQALALQHGLGDRYGEAVGWEGLGLVHHHLAQTREALLCYRRAVDLARSLGDRAVEAAALEGLGDTHREAGDPASASTAWRSALPILDRLGPEEAARVRAKLRAGGATPAPP